jgi:hypothetical protein
LENLRVDGITLIIDLTGMGCETVDWIHLTRDRGKRQAFENAVVNVQVSKNAGDFLDQPI